MTFLHHSLLALEPSMALASFSLSLLIQVHEAAAVVASGGDAGDEWRPPSGSGGLLPCLPVKRATLTGVEARHGEHLPNPAVRRLLLVEVHLRFANVYSRPHTCPPRQLGAARSCTPGGARRGPLVGYVLQSAAPTGSSP